MATDTAPAPLALSDAALTDLERCLSALGITGAAADAVLCAAELYGDLRADEALGA